MIAAVSITPIGMGESVGDSVAEAVAIFRESGLEVETNAMFTNIEGEWDEVMSTLKAAVMAVAEHCPRVSVVVKIDHRLGAEQAMNAKVESIERRLAIRTVEPPQEVA